MTEITPEAVQQSSEYAQDMVNQGFRPNQVDIDAMVSQMAKLQATVDALNAERGVPLDPIDGHRKHLWDHLKVRDWARPDVDMAEVKKLLSALPEVSEHIAATATEALHFAMEQLIKVHPGKELEYLAILTGELHQMVLNRENKKGDAHSRLSELEDELAKVKSQLANMHAEIHVSEPTNG